MAAFGGHAPFPVRLGARTPEEGWTSEQHARAAADLTAVARTVAFAHLTFTKSGSTFVVLGYTAMHDVGIVAAPTFISGGVGVSGIVFANQFLDAYEISEGINFRHVRCTVHGSVALAAMADITAAPQVTVRTQALSGGTPTDPTAGLTVSFYT